MAVPPTHLRTTFDTTTEEPSSIPVLDDPIPSDDSEDDIPSGSYRFRTLSLNDSPESYDDINWPVDPVEPTLIEPSLSLRIPTNEHSSVHLPTNEHPPVPGEFIHSISLSPDGKHIVAGSKDGRVCMFDLCTGNIMGTPPWRTAPQGHRDIVLSVMYSPDGSRVVSGSQDTTIIQWDVTRGWLRPLAQTPKIESVEGNYRGMYTVVYSPDGHRFASISGDSIVRIWDATSCTVLHALAPHEEELDKIRLSGFTWALDGQRIFSYANETICIWDAATGDPLQSQVIGDTWAIQPSHSGDRVVTGGEDGTCRVWDVKTAADKPIAVTKVHEVHVWSVVFSPDDSYVASCSSDHQVIVSDSSSGAPLYSIDTENPAGGYPRTDFEHLVFSPNGKYIITGDEEGCVDVWDLEGKRLAAKTKGHTAGLTTILPSADGRFLYTSGDGSVTVWNLEGITAGSSV